MTVFRQVFRVHVRGEAERYFDALSDERCYPATPYDAALLGLGPDARLVEFARSVSSPQELPDPAPWARAGGELLEGVTRTEEVRV